MCGMFPHPVDWHVRKVGAAAKFAISSFQNDPKKLKS